MGYAVTSLTKADCHVVETGSLACTITIYLNNTTGRNKMQGVFKAYAISLLNILKFYRVLDYSLTRYNKQ